MSRRSVAQCKRFDEAISGVCIAFGFSDPVAGDRGLILALMAIHHVQLAMPPGGEAAARDFYTQGLGLSEVPKPAHLASRGGCWFANCAVQVHLGVDPDFRPARKAHPAFVVTDLAGLIARLVAKGIKITEGQPLAGYDRRYVDDPFGNRIELMEPAGRL